MDNNIDIEAREQKSNLKKNQKKTHHFLKKNFKDKNPNYNSYIRSHQNKENSISYANMVINNFDKNLKNKKILKLHLRKSKECAGHGDGYNREQHSFVAGTKSTRKVKKGKKRRSGLFDSRGISVSGNSRSRVVVDRKGRVKSSKRGRKSQLNFRSRTKELTKMKLRRSISKRDNRMSNNGHFMLEESKIFNRSEMGKSRERILERSFNRANVTYCGVSSGKNGSKGRKGQLGKSFTGNFRKSRVAAKSLNRQSRAKRKAGLRAKTKSKSRKRTSRSKKSKREYKNSLMREKRKPDVKLKTDDELISCMMVELKKEIEDKFGRSSVNKGYKFPRLDQSSLSDSDLDASLDSLRRSPTLYNLSKQNIKHREEEIKDKIYSIPKTSSNTRNSEDMPFAEDIKNFDNRNQMEEKIQSGMTTTANSRMALKKSNTELETLLTKLVKVVNESPSASHQLKKKSSNSHRLFCQLLNNINTSVPSAHGLDFESSQRLISKLNIKSKEELLLESKKKKFRKEGRNKFNKTTTKLGYYHDSKHPPLSTCREIKYPKTHRVKGNNILSEDYLLAINDVKRHSKVQQETPKGLNTSHILDHRLKKVYKGEHMGSVIFSSRTRKGNCDKSRKRKRSKKKVTLGIKIPGESIEDSKTSRRKDNKSANLSRRYKKQASSKNLTLNFLTKKISVSKNRGRNGKSKIGRLSKI